MQIFKALSKGYLVDQNALNGIIHSVFKRSVNIELNNGNLVSLLDHSFANSPCAIRIRSPINDWRTIFRTGEHFVQKQFQLRSISFSLFLGKNLFLWKPEFSYKMNFSNLSSRMKWLEAQLINYVKTKEIQSVLPFCLQKIQQKNIVPLMDDPLSILEQKVQRLIGLGAGLTPDGDDFLLGYLAAFFLFDESTIDLTTQIYRQNLTNLIDFHSIQTNKISRNYLKMAICGHFIEPLHQLAQAMNGNSEQMLWQSTFSVLNYGHSSGANCLLGFLSGIHHRFKECTLKEIHSCH